MFAAGEVGNPNVSANVMLFEKIALVDAWAQE